MGEKLYVTLLAGGKGKRMQSDLPKVLHQIDGKPMIVILLDKIIQLHPDKILIVVGDTQSLIESTISEYYPHNDFCYVRQPVAHGTGDAVRYTLPYLPSTAVYNLILNSDVPLITLSTLKTIVSHPGEMVVTAIHLPDPTGNGRIIMNDGVVTGIIEEKDCDEQQRKITLSNCGIYYVKTDILLDVIPRLTNDNAASEYYLTDIVKLHHGKIEVVILPDSCYLEIYNVNTRQQLQFLLDQL